MNGSPLQRVHEYGQSIWLDYIHRNLLTSGELGRLIEHDGLCGMTSNPAIFERAIASGTDYDADIATLAAAGSDVWSIYDALTQHDVRLAADLFRRVYEDSGGRDGFVSLEVDPRLAHDAQRTIDEARRLWRTLDRPNVMIKVPATRAGLVAIRELVTDGINVNVTLLFDLGRYRDVVRAYLDGIGARLRDGQAVAHVQSVASFFVSRIDTLIDAQLAERPASQAPLATQLRGQVAIASARLAYRIYREVFDSDEFSALARRGAKTQRLLWASTSTKSPDASDIVYVEALIGPDTVTTLPPETLNAYRDHGEPALRLDRDLDRARWVLAQLPAAGIDIDAATNQLEQEGVAKFVKPFEQLLATLGQRAAARR